MYYVRCVEIDHLESTTASTAAMVSLLYVSCVREKRNSGTPRYPKEEPLDSSGEKGTNQMFIFFRVVQVVRVSSSGASIGIVTTCAKRKVT